MLHLRVTGAGAPVLLLHGAPSSAEDFRPVVEAFGRHHRFLWPDLPGYGLSEPVEGRTSVARVQTVLEDAVLSLGIHELAIIGFSFGAYRALSLALNGRVKVTDLVLLSGQGAVPPEQGAVLRELAATLRTDPSGVDAARREWVQRMLTPESREQRPELARQVAGWLDLTRPPLLADELESQAEARDLLPHVGLLRARVTVRCGVRDTFVAPQQSEELCKRIRGAKLQRVPDAAHALLAEDPHRTLEAIDEALRAQVLPRHEG